MSYRLFVLGKSHRPSGGTRMCSACREWKRSVARIVVAPNVDAQPGIHETLSICSGCIASLHFAAVSGRKVERS